MTRLPGHREGIRRHQRYGQQTLDVGKTLVLFCKGCDSPLNEAGYCTNPNWCTFKDRQQRGALPGRMSLAELRLIRSRRKCVVCDDKGCEFCPKV